MSGARIHNTDLPRIVASRCLPSSACHGVVSTDCFFNGKSWDDVLERSREVSSRRRQSSSQRRIQSCVESAQYFLIRPWHPPSATRNRGETFFASTKRPVFFGSIASDKRERSELSRNRRVRTDVHYFFIGFGRFLILLFLLTFLASSSTATGDELTATRGQELVEVSHRVDVTIEGGTSTMLCQGAMRWDVLSTS